MELRRFYVSPQDVEGSYINVTGEEYYHIVKVLRLRLDYKLIICDGSGIDYYCRIHRITQDSVLCEIEDYKQNQTEHKTNLVLCMGLIKSEKLDIAVQKAVELGVTQIKLFTSEYTSEKGVKAERIQRIVMEACKQCGRASLPIVSEPKDLKSVINECVGLKLMAYEKENKNSAASVLPGVKDAQSVCVLVGSEGGFSQQEAEYARENGFITFSLGRRILRAETAAISVLSCISMFLED